MRAANGKAVASFSWLMDETLGADQVLANSRLIAAAPELLSALVLCVACLEARVTSDEVQARIAEARTAIAKATQ